MLQARCSPFSRRDVATSHTVTPNQHRTHAARIPAVARSHLAAPSRRDILSEKPMFRHSRVPRVSTTLLILAALAACATNPAPATTSTSTSDDAFMARARALHERLLTIDTHVDIDPQNFQVGKLNYAHRLNTQVDLTKMEQGGLDAIFFSIYVGQGALDAAGYERAWASGHGEAQRHPPARRGDRAEPHRHRLHGGRRAAHRREREEGGADGRGERLRHRHRPDAREGALRPRRPLHVAGAQRQQPALRLQHRRGERTTGCGATASPHSASR